MESRLLTMLEKKYGDSKDDSGDGDSKDDSGDGDSKDNSGVSPAEPTSSKKPTKLTGKKPLVVGNVLTDRTTVLTEEFDLLFDMESQSAADEGSEMKAEPVGSSSFV